MNPEHARKSPAAKTGRFAVPFSLLRAKGSGAPALRLLALSALALSALLALAVSALAAPPAEFGSEGSNPRGIAVDFIKRVSSALGWARSSSPEASRPASRVRGRSSGSIYVADNGVPA